MAAWLGGALSAGGAVLSGLAAYKSAQKQMKFQREMSGTAVQRQMADMRKAGINPILAAKYGGASTPTGASYSLPNIGAAAVEGYKSVSSAKQMQEQARLTGVQADIQKRTLNMLERENVTMAEIQNSAQNIFKSKTLRAFEAGMSGDYSGLKEPYRSFARKINQLMKSSDMLPVTSGIQSTQDPINMSGKNVGKMFSKIGEAGTSLGISAFSETGMSIMRNLGLVK